MAPVGTSMVSPLGEVIKSAIAPPQYGCRVTSTEKLKLRNHLSFQPGRRGLLSSNFEVGDARGRNPPLGHLDDNRPTARGRGREHRRAGELCTVRRERALRRHSTTRRPPLAHSPAVDHRGG